MDKRFVKNNLLLIVVSSVALLVAAVLLVVSIIEYVQTNTYIGNARDLRRQIEELGRKNPSPVEGNKEPIRHDTRLFATVTDEINRHFGRPFEAALDKFIATLKFDLPKEEIPEDVELKPEEMARLRKAYFIRKFQEGWNQFDPDKYSEHFVFWQKFKKDFPNWDEAARVFITEAQPKTVEKIERGTNSDQILQQALGVKRSFYGTPEQRALDLRSYMIGIQKSVDESLAGVNRVCDSSFGFDLVNAAYPPEDFPNIIRHWEVIGDMMRRLGDSKVKVLHNLIVRVPEGEAGRPNFSGSFESVGNYEIAHYTIEITGRMSAIRDFANRLDAAFADNRLYVVRSIFLYAEEDGAGNLFQKNVEAANPEEEAQPSTPRRGRRGRRLAMDEDMPSSRDDEAKRLMDEARRRQEEREKSLPFHKRSGYGDMVAGGNQECRAVFDIDYVVLNK